MIENSDVVREYNIDKIVYELCSNDNFVAKIINEKLYEFDINDTDEEVAVLSVYSLLTAEFVGILTLMFLMTPKTAKKWSIREYEEAVYKQFDDACIERFFQAYPIMSNLEVFKAWFGDSIPVTTETMLDYRRDVISLADMYIESCKDKINLDECAKYISEFFTSTKKNRLRHMMLRAL